MNTQDANKAYAKQLQITATKWADYVEAPSNHDETQWASWNRERYTLAGMRVILFDEGRWEASEQATKAAQELGDDIIDEREAQK